MAALGLATPPAGAQCPRHNLLRHWILLPQARGPGPESTSKAPQAIWGPLPAKDRKVKALRSKAFARERDPGVETQPLASHALCMVSVPASECWFATKACRPGTGQRLPHCGQWHLGAYAALTP